MYEMWTRAQRMMIVFCLTRYEATAATLRIEGKEMKVLMLMERQARPSQAFGLGQLHRLVLHRPYH